MSHFLLFALGLIYANFLEWFFHKYFLHGLGKNKSSRWSYHFDHHRKCILSRNYDSDYENLDKGNQDELKALALGAFLHLPMSFISLSLYLGAGAGALIYFLLHRKCHLEPKWCERYLPWHYVHHMRKPDYNWCVTYPLFDILLGTYMPYAKAYPRESTQDKS